jgi:hypothetical protein
MQYRPLKLRKQPSSCHVVHKIIGTFLELKAQIGDFTHEKVERSVR